MLDAFFSERMNMDGRLKIIFERVIALRRHVLSSRSDHVEFMGGCAVVAWVVSAPRELHNGIVRISTCNQTPCDVRYFLSRWYRR